jgi:hypothetical protein
MINRQHPLVAFSLLLVCAAILVAQRPRTVNDDPATPAKPSTPAPSTVKAKYEGGVFGYPNKMNGTLTLDQANKRLVFRDGKQQERMSIPYGSITGAYADTHSVRPGAATVASNIPYGFPAGFIKTKVQYLTLQFNDPDSNASGATSFKLENKDILDSVLNALATDAGLTKRGEIFVRKKND